MSSLIDQGLAKGLIIFDGEKKQVTYKTQNKRLRFSDPEEKVRANAYLSLIFDYGYKPEQIDLEVAIEHRVPNIYADIVVYADSSLKKPLIVVECKREEASQGELDQAVEQGFGYANSMDADFVWMTSGIRNDYFRRDRQAPKERINNRLADLPRAGQKEVSRARFTKGGVHGFELRIVEENDLTRIFKQAHDALWAGGKRNPAEAFDELDKLIFCKIWDERMPRKKGVPYDFQVFSDDKGDALKQRIQGLYQNGRAKDPEVFKEDTGTTLPSATCSASRFPKALPAPPR